MDSRRESIDTVLGLAEERRDGARLVVTGCLAERYGDELADALPEADAVAGFGVPVTLGRRRGRGDVTPPSFDLLELPRPASPVPWAYVKVAEGCDRACGFCAIPSFRGPQRSRSIESILAEIDALAVAEVVLVAQDLAAFGRDQGRGDRAIVPLVRAAATRVPRVRLLYLYPSDLSDELVDAVCATGLPYFDLSLQHVSRPLLRRMRRWGDGDRFLDRVNAIRTREPDAAFRSNFIVGYPGETEDDHDRLLRFVTEADLDWCGFFAYSPEEGTYAAGLDGVVAPGLVGERLAELRERQDGITARKRDELVGRRVGVLVDTPGVGRSHREAPEIDGVIMVPTTLAPGSFHDVTVTAALGTDLEARPASSAGSPRPTADADAGS
jgi:ribosomal protein S12 methylthiotransferase